MATAALITFLIAAVGGFILLGQWLTHGGGRAGTSPAAGASTTTTTAASGGSLATATAPSKLPTPVVFGHFLLAVVALILWIIYLAGSSPTGLAWVTLVVLAVVAVLGIGMLLRWRTSGCPVHKAGAEQRPERPESHFPVPVVVGHGLFAVATVVLVLLTALKV